MCVLYLHTIVLTGAYSGGGIDMKSFLPCYVPIHRQSGNLNQHMTGWVFEFRVSFSFSSDARDILGFIILIMPGGISTVLVYGLLLHFFFLTWPCIIYPYPLWHYYLLPGIYYYI